MSAWIAEGAPESGRRSTLVEALERLHEIRPRRPCIVEVGTSRNTTPAACQSDGWATRVFAWFAGATGGRLTTIDNRPIATERARDICGPWSNCVTFVCGDAVEAVRDLAPADLLYMDGPPEPDTHLRVYQALRHRPPLILIDDILDEHFRVKGEALAPVLFADGYRLVFNRDRQALFEL